MAHQKNIGNKSIASGGEVICVATTPSLSKLDKKLALVAAALGKKKGDIIAAALDEYLTKMWAEVLKSYSEDRDNG